MSGLSKKGTFSYMAPEMYKGEEYDAGWIFIHWELFYQDTHLFTGTIRDNIRWGKKDATDTEIMEALDITQIIEAILTLIIAVAGTYYTYMRRKASNAEQLDKWVKLAVGAAEQAYKLSLTTTERHLRKSGLRKRVSPSTGISWMTHGMTSTWRSRLPSISCRQCSAQQQVRLLLDGKGRNHGLYT